MLLRNVKLDELADIYARNAKCTSAPHLKNPETTELAVKFAKKNALWEQLNQLDP